MNRVAAVAPSVGDIDPAGWLDCFDDMFAQVVASAFGRREPRLRAEAYLLGLVSGLERKNGWTIAEFAGDKSPLGMQRLLNQAVWDQDQVRDRLVRYAAAELGDPGGILIADETGFLKPGALSAGVQRQYAGTAGKITNCQVGVFLAYAVPARGIRVLADRELYVPESWTSDRDRCGQAGIGQDVEFATKPQLAKTMIGRVRELDLPFAWFTADEAYGDNGKLREWLEESQVSYVVAVSRGTLVPAGAGRTIRADQLAAKVPGRGWQVMSCGPGSKGERLHDWAIAPAGQGRQLLIRRSLTSGELAFYLCWSPKAATLAELVRVAGARRAVEEMFQAAKNETAHGSLPGQKARRLVPARHPGTGCAGLARRRGSQSRAARRPARRRARCQRPGQRGGRQPVDNDPARLRPLVTA